MSLHYIFQVEVDLEVFPSNSFIKLETQPLKDTLGRTIVAFQRNEVILKEIFSSNWRGKVYLINLLSSLNETPGIYHLIYYKFMYTNS